MGVIFSYAFLWELEICRYFEYIWTSLELLLPSTEFLRIYAECVRGGSVWRDF